MRQNRLKDFLLKAINTAPSLLRYPIVEAYLRFYCPIIIGPIRYLRFYRLLKESQWWPRWKLEQYQTEKLMHLLRYAFDNVPYYTELFKRNNLSIDDIKTIKDLRKIPILTKEDIVRNLDKLISRKVNKKYLELVCTSGSTGKPMQFYRDRRYAFLGRAYAHRQADIMNVRIYDKHIYIWSRPFVEKGIKDIYLYGPHLRRLSLSSLPASLNLCDKYLKLMKHFKPVFIQGNPSMLYNLACFAQENNINGISFKCFISFFENIFPYQREAIKKQFKCQIYSHYISEERVISATECLRHEGMHINMERGILEIVDENGKVLPEDNQGKMVATGLYNFAMPFIRYDTGDIGSVSEKPCSCGRGLPLLKSFDGRASEVIKYKDKIIYSTTLSFLLWKFKNIKECQFIQEYEDEIKVNIVRRKDYSEKDTRELIETLKRMLDDELNVHINFADYIPRTKMGKFAFIVSRLKTNENRV